MNLRKSFREKMYYFTKSLGKRNIFFAYNYDSELIQRIKKLRTEGRGHYLSTEELVRLVFVLRQLDKVKGDLAEVGVYNGGTARLICENQEDKTLHLFDTYEGLPKSSEYDKGFIEGEYACSLNIVKEYLKEYPLVRYHKGLFPKDTSQKVADRNFSFVHLDVDLYESTKDALEFFYLRMNQGGVILTHDYPGSPGVVKAFDDFFKDKPEIIIQISSNQAMVVKA